MKKNIRNNEFKLFVGAKFSIFYLKNAEIYNLASYIFVVTFKKLQNKEI